MVHTCSSYGCKERFIKGGLVSFHCFPSDEALKRKWVESMNRPNFVPSKNSKLCSKHFTLDCFDLQKFGAHWLKADAVPTVFECSKDTATMNYRKNQETNKSVARKSTAGFSPLGKGMDSAPKTDLPEGSKSQISSSIEIDKIGRWHIPPDDNHCFIAKHKEVGKVPPSKSETEPLGEEAPSKDIELTWVDKQGETSSKRCRVSVKEMLTWIPSNSSNMQEFPNNVNDINTSGKPFIILKPTTMQNGIPTNIPIPTTNIPKIVTTNNVTPAHVKKITIAKHTLAPNKITIQKLEDQLINVVNEENFETQGMALLRGEFRELKKNINRLQGEVEVWQAHYGNLKIRYESLVKEHEEVINKQKKEVEMGVASVLSRIFTPGQMKKLLNTGKTRIHWSHRDMQNAMALRNISPRAYCYLRNRLKYPLPAPSSLHKFKLVLTRNTRQTVRDNSIDYLTPPKSSMEMDSVENSMDFQQEFLGTGISNSEGIMEISPVLCGVENHEYIKLDEKGLKVQSTKLDYDT